MASRIGTLVQRGVVLTLFGMTLGGVALLGGGLYSYETHKVSWAAAVAAAVFAAPLAPSIGMELTAVLSTAHLCGS